MPLCGDAVQVQTCFRQRQQAKAGATTEDTTPKDTDQLHDDHVIGDGISVRRCSWTWSREPLSPSLQTQIEDKEAEGEEDEDVGDGEGCEDEEASSVVKAPS